MSANANACQLQGDLVYLPVPGKNDYVDDQKVTLPEEVCYVPDGTFSYEAQNGKKTVLKNLSYQFSSSENARGMPNSLN